MLFIAVNMLGTLKKIKIKHNTIDLHLKKLTKWIIKT